MSNLGTVASILACSLSLLTGFLIFPETASGQYQYSAYVAALINQYKQGKEIVENEQKSKYPNSGSIILGLQMQNQSSDRIVKFLSRVNQAVRKNPSRSDCEEGRDYYEQLIGDRDIDIIAVRSLYTEFNRFC